ncbi:MAG TPA: isochorismatase family cysteine hydrolase [Longimicrobiaceae bacterium]|nr:isochorismatase family cysteine hydrolase [Longimicrobiaceae bacterium]
MPRKNHDLHGNAPDSSPVAVVLVDVINDLEFPGGEALLPHALAAADKIASLRRSAKRLGVPVVYANDNFGRWRSDFREVVEHVRGDGVRGAPLAELLAPGREDYFVLKPKHSAFYATTLDTLLEYLGATRLVLAGFTTDICVQFTAHDAYMRDFELHVPADCVAAETAEQSEEALAYMRRVLDASVEPSTALDLAALRRPAGCGEGDDA